MRRQTFDISLKLGTNFAVEKHRMLCNPKRLFSRIEVLCCIIRRKQSRKQTTFNVRPAAAFPFLGDVSEGIYQAAVTRSLFWETAKPAQKKRTNTHTHTLCVLHWTIYHVEGKGFIYNANYDLRVRDRQRVFGSGTWGIMGVAEREQGEHHVIIN